MPPALFYCSRTLDRVSYCAMSKASLRRAVLLHGLGLGCDTPVLLRRMEPGELLVQPQGHVHQCQQHWHLRTR